MTEPSYKCWVKATNRESGVPRRSGNWVAAKRGWFNVFADRLECGRWTIPVASIRKAVMYAPAGIRRRGLPRQVGGLGAGERGR